MAGFGLFVAAMTACRFAGTHLLDRFGRTAVLWSTMVAAGVGVLLIVLGGHPALVVRRHRALGRGRLARLPGRHERRRRRPRPRGRAGERRLDHRVRRVPRRPPLLGFVGDRVGTLDALLVVAVLLVPAALAVPAARRPVPAEVG